MVVGMLGNLLCLMLGGFVGVAAMAICNAGSDHVDEAYKQGYAAGEKEGWRRTCMRLRTDCPAYERFIERGE